MTSPRPAAGSMPTPATSTVESTSTCGPRPSRSTLTPTPLSTTPPRFGPADSSTAPGSKPSTGPHSRPGRTSGNQTTQRPSTPPHSNHSTAAMTPNGNSTTQPSTFARLLRHRRPISPTPTDSSSKLCRAAWQVCEAAERHTLATGPHLAAHARAGTNLPEFLRGALEVVAAEVGGPDTLVKHRPGSWEAEHVLALGHVWRFSDVA